MHSHADERPGRPVGLEPFSARPNKRDTRGVLTEAFQAGVLLLICIGAIVSLLFVWRDDHESDDLRLRH